MGHSIKNRLIDTSYGFFSYKVRDDVCTSPESGELVRHPYLVLQKANEVLQENTQLLAILRGERGKVPGSLMSFHWVSAFAQLQPQQRLALQEEVKQIGELVEGQTGISPAQQNESFPGLSQELATAAFLYVTCSQKIKKGATARANARESHKDGIETFSSLGLSTQMFLPGRFLGNPQQLCGGLPSEAYDENNICTPPLGTALQLVPLRLHKWWSEVRWQYHYPEYVRKLLTVLWPLDPYMHLLYRQDMYAMLSLMSPYLELEPPVPIDQTCGPPSSYWVVPLPREEWGKKRRESPSEVLTDVGPLSTTASGSATEPEEDSAARKPAAAPSLFSVPKVHHNYVPVDEYCQRARKTHHGFFTGKPREKPVKIVDAVILGVDLDMLEVRWHELYHSVDYFVVAEAHHHSLGIFQKPLFFDRNKKRYAAFADKIIHLVHPFESSLPVAQLCSRRLLGDEDACWEYEMFQRHSMLQMIAQINAGVNDYGNPHIPPGFLGDSDLVLISDVDEIVMGDRLRHLKYCEPFPQKQFSWVLVHYPGRVDAMALKEFKAMSGISNTPYPNGIGPLADVIPYKFLRHLETKTDFAYEGRSYVRHFTSELNPQQYLHGGWHFSDTSYLPYLFFKIPSDDLKPGYEPWGLYAPLLAQRGVFSSPVGGPLQSQVAAWKDFRDYRQVGSLCVDAKDVPEQYKEIGFGLLPWVMRCNPMRYPTWFQQPDPRYFMRPRSSFVIYGESVNARSLEEWFSIFRFVRDTFSADISQHAPLVVKRQ